jgi:hypothetical protein
VFPAFTFAGRAFGPVVLTKSARIDATAALSIIHLATGQINKANAVSDFAAHSAKGDGFWSARHLQAILRFCSLSLYYFSFDGCT